MIIALIVCKCRVLAPFLNDSQFNYDWSVAITIVIYQRFAHDINKLKETFHCFYLYQLDNDQKSWFN